MTMAPELQSKIAIWRAKAREGTLSQDEMKEAIQALRQDRTAAAATSAASKTRKAATTAKKNVNSDDLLSELDGL